MILYRVVFYLAFIMQHTFTNAREPIRGEEGGKIEGSDHNHQDSNHSTDTITSYLRGDSKYSSMSNIRSEMSDRNLGVTEKCDISSGTYFIQSVSRGTYLSITPSVKDRVSLTMTKKKSLFDNSYIRSLGNNEYAIQSPWLERYISVPKKGKYITVDTQTYVGSKETFYITCLENGEVAFKSKKYGTYLRADKDKVNTYTKYRGDNERWRLITEGVHAGPKPEKTYYIKTYFGYYISMNDKNKVKLMEHKKSYERITLRSLCDYKNDFKCDFYAIKSATHGERYLSGASSGPTIGAQTYVGDNEIFLMETQRTGTVQFWSKKYLYLQNMRNFLYAHANEKEKLETRDFILPHHGNKATEFMLIPVW